MENDPQFSPPTAQTGEGDSNRESLNDLDWLQLGKRAFESSVSFMDTNYRKQWDDSIRAFHNMFPSESKYNAASYDKRSRLFRPKIRTISRKNEAAAAAAFFSSMDVINVKASDPNNLKQQASAEVNKALLQYRLTKSIPWFQTVIGGLQDAQNTGVACAHVYWEYEYKEETKDVEVPLTPEEVDPEYPQQGSMPQNSYVSGPSFSMTGEDVRPKTVKKVVSRKILKDQPCIDLIPTENLLIDPASSWVNPVETSPYIIHLIPMYVGEVKRRMEIGEWIKRGDGDIRVATQTTYDSTRAARQSNREDAYSNSKTISDYETCWIQRHIHRRDGEDWEFYMLGNIALLTEPRPLIESVFHGKRPFVMGCCILETHKVYPSSVYQLGKGLQDESNEIVNQRIDNVKFVLNKKWFAKRGKQVDLGGLVRNVPGGVVMMDDPEKDVREITWPDVTASSYEEQSRIDNDMNDLLGNFSAGQVMADQGINAPARNMAMLGQHTGTLVEYMLRTYVETFIQPVLRHLVLLEQEYETDAVILELASKSAQLLEKLGQGSVTNDVLKQDLALTVNVGMGATDPQMKLAKFMSAMELYTGLLRTAPPGINMAEVGKEIFSYMGYQDGSRFLTHENPQLLVLQQQLEQATSIIQNLQDKMKDKQDALQVKVMNNRENNALKWATTQLHEDNENLRNATTHLGEIRRMDDDFRNKQMERAQQRVDHVRISKRMRDD